MALCSDSSTAGALALPVTDVLGEGGSPNDGRLVHLSVLPDIVDRTITGDRANLLALGRAGAVASVLLNIVLHERVGGPSINRYKHCASLGLGRAAEVDLSGTLSAAGISVHYSLTYRVVPVFHPLPTTKSPALENDTEYPLLVGL